jgi:hypothetical protein
MKPRRPPGGFSGQPPAGIVLELTAEEIERILQWRSDAGLVFPDGRTGKALEDFELARKLRTALNSQPVAAK